MNYRAIFVLIFIALLASPVFAHALSLNYTKLIQYPEQARYNQSYMIATGNSTSVYEWFFITILGLVFFILSLFASTKPENNQIDALLAALSTLPILISALTSTAIDVVTGYGATSQPGTDPPSTVDYIVTYVLENHTIYHFDLTSIFLWILFAVSVLNLIRILLNHRRYETMFKPYGGPQQ